LLVLPKGRSYTVRYEAVNAMLLNEFLEEHGQVQRLEATVAQQQKQIEALIATVQKNDCPSRPETCTTVNRRS
jgi:hypothetical protein